jgi:hypothetical protein
MFSDLSAGAVSFLRTAVPVLWGSFGTWFAATLPGVNDFLLSVNIDLSSESTVLWVSGAAVVLWYAFWRWLEPRLPAWATRLVLGSNQRPSYGDGGDTGDYSDSGDGSTSEEV